MTRTLPCLVVAVHFMAACCGGAGRSSSNGHQPLAERVPVVMQAGQNDCGLAALATMLSELEQRTTLAEVSAGIVIPKGGLSMLVLQRIAAQHSVNLEGVLDRKKRLDRWRFPWIAHWADGVQEHYVLVENASERAATLADPAVGRVTMDVNEFVRRWSGRALILADRSVPQASVSGGAELGGIALRKQIGGAW